MVASSTVLMGIHSESASFTQSHEGNEHVYFLQGVWSVHTLHGVEQELAAALSKNDVPVVIRLDDLVHLDTAAALSLNLIQQQRQHTQRPIRLETTNVRFQQLLTTSVPVAPLASGNTDKAGVFHQFLWDIGKVVHDLVWLVQDQLAFLGLFCMTLVRLLRHPRRFRLVALVFSMEQAGLRALPIVALLTFLIGMVVGYMGAEELARFGAQVFAVNLLEVTIMREMAVLITAIVVAGRSSSAFTAQIGAMVANEEVAAINSMGLDPMELLVVPRVLGLFFTLPLLVFLAGMMALLGGAMALWYAMDMSIPAFIERYYTVCSLKNFFVGIIKAPFFALIIGIIGCYQGFKATTSAESVGFLTTKAVVQAIFYVIVLDALFAIFFTAVGM